VDSDRFEDIQAELEVMKARAIACESLVVSMLGLWGQPKESVGRYLKFASEHFEATLLANPVSDEALGAFREVIEGARGILEDPPQSAR
jgi:hypothetical protein